MLTTGLFPVLEQTADAAFAVDGQGRIRSWNRAAEQLLGHPAAEVLQSSCAELIDGRDAQGTQVCRAACEVLKCSAAGQCVPHFDLEVKSRAGHRQWVNVSILVVPDEETGGVLAVHLVRDIHQRKQTEQLTRQMVEVARRLSRMAEETPRPEAPPAVTGQERRLLRMLADGKGPAEVARELRITPSTFRNHLHHINRKLRTKTRLEAVMHALNEGII